MRKESSDEIENMKCSLLVQETTFHQLQFKYDAELQSKLEQVNQLKNELSSAKAEKMMILEAKGAHQTFTQMKEEWLQEKRSFIENVEKVSIQLLRKIMIKGTIRVEYKEARFESSSITHVFGGETTVFEKNCPR
jgi:G:T/U-mismatch repair DNA glycosylase